MAIQMKIPSPNSNNETSSTLAALTGTSQSSQTRDFVTQLYKELGNIENMDVNDPNGKWATFLFEHKEEILKHRKGDCESLIYLGDINAKFWEEHLRLDNKILYEDSHSDNNLR